MSYALYNTGIDCMPSDAELGKLFGNRGSMFLKEVPAKVMNQRGYGNMPCPYPISAKAVDVNIKYPDYKLHSGTFHNVFTDFPKGPGGVSPNPMWADGTYEEMKANFNKQADEQNDVRHLIPDLESQRLKEYELSQFTGGSAQQNKVEFAIGELFNAEKRADAQRKYQQIKQYFPNISDLDAFKIIAKDTPSGSLSLTRLHQLLKIPIPLSEWRKTPEGEAIVDEHIRQEAGVLNIGVSMEQLAQEEAQRRRYEGRGGEPYSGPPVPTANANPMPGADFAGPNTIPVGEEYTPYSGKSRSIVGPPSTMAYDAGTPASHSARNAENAKRQVEGERRAQMNRLEGERRAQMNRLENTMSEYVNEQFRSKPPMTRQMAFGAGYVPSAMSRQQAGTLPSVGTMATPAPIRGVGQGSGGGGRPVRQPHHPAFRDVKGEGDIDNAKNLSFFGLGRYFGL